MRGRPRADTASRDTEPDHTSRFEIQRTEQADSGRTVVVSTRVSAREAAQLRRLAGKRSLAEWLRTIVLDQLTGNQKSASRVEPLPTLGSSSRIYWTCNYPAATGPTGARFRWLNGPHEGEVQ